MPNPIPSSIDAERALIGVLLREQLKPLPELKSSDFYEPKHADIYAAMETIAQDGHLPDELNVTELLRKWNSPVQAAYISALTTEVGFSILNKQWAESIKRTSTLRAIVETATRALELSNEPATDPRKLTDYLVNNLNAISAINFQDKKLEGAQNMLLDDLLSFDKENDPNNVFGNRWLCKGGSLLWVGQSGTGKSTAMTQAAVQWCLGRDFFGIGPKKPLKIIILQAENDAGDCSEQLKGAIGNDIHPADLRVLKENLFFYRDATSTGKKFVRTMRELILKHSCDVFICDPLLSFAGIDLSQQKEVTNFLRHDLAPVLMETGCIFIAMHHTGKPMKAADKEGQTTADLAYSGFGSSEFVNFFRETAVLMRMPGENPVFKFALTKRRSRSNMRNANGDFSPEILIRHSRDRNVLRWEYATSEDAPQSQDASKSSGNRPPRR